MSIYFPGTLLDNRPVIGWHSVLRPQDIVAGSELINRPALNLWSPDTAGLWEPSATNSYLTLINATGGTVNYIGIARHNLGSGAIAYNIENSPDGTNWFSLKAIKTVSDDSAIIEYFAPSSLPFFRIYFTQSGSAKPRIAHVKLGRLLVLTSKIYVGHKPASLVRYADGITQTSENGQYLGRINTAVWRRSAVSQANVDPAFVRLSIMPFVAHANNTAADDGTAQGPYFFAWRPADYSNDVVYGWTHSTIHPDNQQPNGLMGFSFDVECIA